ncbi:MAG: VapC toxin family PIN domain ribonuclease [Acidobacteria bacterium]|nr:MAG: VapC toxin family PIN domain ribonuclease [Acidobacteriota bacterium]
MKAVDTSVVVPAVLAWHENHRQCYEAASNARIPSHALLESYSVLTRLPSQHRITAEVAAQLLGEWFLADDVLLAPARLQRGIARELAAAGIEGGAAYDALIGLTARTHGAILLTRDERAARYYRALDISHEFVE